MKQSKTLFSSHPAQEVLALFLSRDLSPLSRWRVARHVHHCGDCEQHVMLLRSARTELQREARTETLTGFEAIADWSSLERDMLGNIAVGLSAARCIEKVGVRNPLLSRLAFAGGLTLLFILGWFTHVPAEQNQRLFGALRMAVGLDRPVTAGSILRSTPDGLVVGSQGSTLTIMHPATAVISLSGASGVEARYVDEDTGQVTITDVYGQ